jgi:predicted acylesterase/phospholipase RssA
MTLSHKKIYPFNNYECVVFAGAGAAGGIYIGAFNEMHRRGYTKNIKAVGGSSAGAIVALAIGLGWRGEALEDRLLRQDYADFLKIDFNELLGIFKNIRHRSGVLSGKELRRWGQEMMAERLGNPRLDFAGWKEYQEAAKRQDLAFFEEKFNQATAPKQKADTATLIERPDFVFDFNSPAELMANAASLLELRVMGAKATRETAVDENGKPQRIDKVKKRIFSAAESPTVPIAQAVKASASYPFVFRQTDIEGELHTDAGVAEHTPFSLFAAEAQQGKVLGFNTDHFIRHAPIQPKPLAPHLQRLKKVLLGDTSPTEAAQQFLGWVFSQKRLAYTEELLSRSKQAILDDPLLRRNTLTLDRGNVGSTDFLAVGKPENRWLMESSRKTTAADITRFEHAEEKSRLMRENPPPLPHQRTPKKFPRIIGQRPTHPRISTSDPNTPQQGR